uniref:Uncharacterized protein MLCB1701.13 n=1 Tax=Mycobacterium leprae TaxID=1769 RepID=Q9Z5J8_MYCLR|nr:hypothetical protein MLCB1701.13 [Mycobacterium leprae]
MVGTAWSGQPIRAVTDILGNRMAETVCECMRTSTVQPTPVRNCLMRWSLHCRISCARTPNLTDPTAFSKLWRLSLLLSLTGTKCVVACGAMISFFGLLSPLSGSPYVVTVCGIWSMNSSVFGTLYLSSLLFA